MVCFNTEYAIEAEGSGMTQVTSCSGSLTDISVLQRPCEAELWNSRYVNLFSKVLM